MRFSTTQAAVLLAAAAAVVCGCDRATGLADREVRTQLTTAYGAAAAGEDQQAASAFQDAVKLTSASPEMRAVAKSALARTQLTSAYRLMGQVDVKELELSRLVTQATLLAQQVRGGGTAIASYKQYDPKPITEAIAQKVQEAQGSANQPDWFKGDNTSLPTLTAAKQNVAKIDGDIAQLQEQQKNLDGERSKLLTDAAAAAAQSENSKGRESVDVYKKASDLRKLAGEKAVELDKLAVQIGRQQADLAIAQAQQSVVEGAITQLQQNAQQRETNWKQIDADVNNRKDFAAKILGPEDSAGTIAAFGKQIADKAKEVSDLRGQAEAAANDSVKYYQDANKDAEEASQLVRAKLSDPANATRTQQLAAYKQQQETIAPLNYKFQESNAQRTLGSLYASEAASLGRRIALKEAVDLAADSIGQPAPASISADLNNDRQSKLSLADDAFKNAEARLVDVIDGGSTDQLKAAARVGRVLTYYDWSLLDKLAGNEKAAGEHLAAAVTDRNAAAENQISLPALPVDLGSVPTPTTAPAANG